MRRKQASVIDQNKWSAGVSLHFLYKFIQISNLCFNPQYHLKLMELLNYLPFFLFAIAQSTELPGMSLTIKKQFFKSMIGDFSDFLTSL